MSSQDQQNSTGGRAALRGEAHDLPARLLEAARVALSGLGRAHEDLEMRPTPIVSGQARIYLLERGGKDLYVAKVVAGAEAATAQYRALETCHGWWDDEDAHAVACPRALLADCNALLLDYVPGRNLARVLGSSRPGATGARFAARAAGDFLRRFHEHGAAGAVEIQVSDMVAEILISQAACLTPLGLALPPAAREALDDMASHRLTVRRVLLHGDYAPRNLIVTGAHEVAMIDPVLRDHGPADNDVAAFLALMSSASVFASGVAFPPVRQARLALARAFLDGYGRENISPVICSLRLIDELIWRWASRRTRPLDRTQGLLPGLRAALIDAQMAALIEEAAATLADAPTAPTGRRRRRAPASARRPLSAP